MQWLGTFFLHIAIALHLIAAPVNVPVQSVGSEDKKIPWSAQATTTHIDTTATKVGSTTSSDGEIVLPAINLGSKVTLELHVGERQPFINEVKGLPTEKGYIRIIDSKNGKANVEVQWADYPPVMKWLGPDGYMVSNSFSEDVGGTTYVPITVTSIEGDTVRLETMVAATYSY